MKEINLKPCPFCGGEAKVNTTFNGYYYVICDSTKCACSPATIAFVGRLEAIDNWNRRAGETDDNAQ